jgi:uncharacterized protein (DUF4415 family)
MVVAIGGISDSSAEIMANKMELAFEEARRISAREVRAARKAIEKKTGKKRALRGRPAKPAGGKLISTSIRLHPQVLQWAKREAKKQGCGYQPVINEVLLAKAI